MFFQCLLSRGVKNISATHIEEATGWWREFKYGVKRRIAKKMPEPYIST
jgi:hypothetical protein